MKKTSKFFFHTWTILFTILSMMQWSKLVASGEMLNEDKRDKYIKLIIRRKGVVKIIEASKGWWLEADRP